MRRALTTGLQQQERSLQALQRRLEAQNVTRRLAVIRGRLGAADARLRAAAAAVPHRATATLHALAGRLDSLSPLAVLGRGYAVCWNDQRTAIVRDPGRARARRPRARHRRERRDWLRGADRAPRAAATTRQIAEP